jgi:D-alanyl-D-alanine carboxypeptidase
LFGAVAKAPLSSSEIEAHFDSALLAKVSPAHLNSTFVAFESLAVDSVTSSTASTIDVVVTVHAGAQLSVDLSVNTRGLISSLQFLPVGATPSSVAPEVPSTWAGVEADFNFIAPDVRFVVASASNGSCRAIASSGADTATPLASSFKLVVLDALAKAIEARRVSWNEQLTVTSALRSVKSSVLQAEPDGTRISVQDAASDMISISDNTAAGSTCPTPGGDSAARR